MSERLNYQDSGEKLDLDVDVAKQLERAREQAEKATEISPDQIEHLKRAVQEKAVSGREITVGEREKSAPSHSFGTHKQLKAHSYKRTLSSIQSRLKGPEKAFSRVIHRKVIERASNIGAYTIARPSGILMGGAMALLGSTFSLYLAKRYGFNYNFSIFILLFVGGYILGSLGELSIRVLRRRR